MEHHESLFANPRTWVAIAFVLFFVLFGKTLVRAVTGLLDKRADRVRADLEEAARLRTEAEAMLADATARREQAMADAKQMIEGAQAEAARLSAAAMAEATTAAARREKMATDRIAAAEKAAIDEVRLTAADIATAAARDLIATTLSPDASAHLIDTAIAGLPAALAKRAA